MRIVNNLKTGLLLSGLMAICMLLGHVMGGPQGVLMGLVLGGAGSIISYWFSDKIAVAAMGAQQISREDLPWLFDSLERMTQRAGLPMPRVYVCPQDAPNAFATGRNPQNSAVAITQGMLRHFPRNEIEAVMAHELAHIKHRDVLISTIAAVMAGMISYAGYMVMFMGGGNNRENNNPLGAIGALLMIVLAPVAAMMIQMAISRQREFAADSFAGELVGQPLHLAAALNRLRAGNERIPTDTNPAFHALYICEPLHRGVTNLFTTHPPIEKRIAALETQAMAMGVARPGFRG